MTDSFIRLVIYAGVGGAEAQAWSKMLVNQYRRWLERNHYTFQELESEPGQFKFEIPDSAAEKLASEHGIHRLVRIPPDCPHGRRQISFAMVSLDGQKGEAEPVRTYVFDPEALLKNDKTGSSNSLLNEVLDGELSLAP